MITFKSFMERSFRNFHLFFCLRKWIKAFRKNVESWMSNNLIFFCFFNGNFLIKLDSGDLLRERILPVAFPFGFVFWLQVKEREKFNELRLSEFVLNCLQCLSPRHIRLNSVKMSSKKWERLSEPSWMRAYFSVLFKVSQNR